MLALLESSLLHAQGLEGSASFPLEGAHRHVPYQVSRLADPRDVLVRKYGWKYFGDLAKNKPLMAPSVRALRPLLPWVRRMWCSHCQTGISSPNKRRARPWSLFFPTMSSPRQAPQERWGRRRPIRTPRSYGLNLWFPRRRRQSSPSTAIIPCSRTSRTSTSGSRWKSFRSNGPTGSTCRRTARRHPAGSTRS